MTIRVDPERSEIRALLDMVDLTNHHVLEVGAGDGRLTWRYADKARRVTAVEPFADAVARARSKLPDAWTSKVEFQQLDFRDFAVSSEASRYDTAILAWSLCCMQPEDMIHALEELHRLLRPGGILIDIRPTSEASLIEVWRRGRICCAEPEPGEDAHGNDHAENAIGFAVDQGLFVVEERAEFDLRVYASSVKELRDFFADSNAYEPSQPTDAELAVSADFYARVERIMKTAGEGAEVVFHERGKISRMRPLSRQ